MEAGARPAQPARARREGGGGCACGRARVQRRRRQCAAARGGADAAGGGSSGGSEAWVVLPARGGGHGVAAAPVAAVVGRHAERRRVSPEEESLVSLIDALEERHAALDDEVDAMARGAGGGARSDSAPARALKRDKLRVRDRLALARRALAELRAPRIVLGEGAEGEVLLARGSDTGRLAAVKVVRADGADGERRLQREVSVLRALAHARGFPDVMYFGPAGGKGGAGHLCAVMTLCGPSLERLSWETAGGGGLSAPTALALAAQAVERLRDLHAAGYAHRDVSPTNLLMGTCDERNTLFLLDMGLAVRVKDGPSACGELRADERDSRGADAFVAAAVDEGGSAEAADDVEMLAWAMAWLLSGGQLPWACGADVGDALSRAAHKRRCARDAACFVDWLDAEGNVRIEEAERAVFSTLAGVAAEAQDARAEGRAVRYDAVLVLLKEAGGDQDVPWDWETQGVSWREDGSIVRV